MIKTKMIAESLSPDDAIRVILNTDSKINITSVSEVYYPYIFFRYLVVVGKGKLAKLNKLCDCVIDAISGSTYEGKGNPTLVDVEIEEKDVLDSRLNIDDCRVTGHNFVMKQYLNKAKLLMTPVVETIIEETFHKKFYIINCKDIADLDYYIMMDAVDGGISVLDCAG